MTDPANKVSNPLQKMLLEIEARAKESVEVRMGGKRINKDEFGLLCLEQDIPRLLACLRRAVEQRNISIDGGGWDGWKALCEKYDAELSALLSPGGEG